MNSKIQIRAKVKYYTRNCVAYTDPSLARYYFSLCPKYLRANGQRYDSHITIVRGGVETVEQNWGYRDGETIIIEYIPILYTDGIYIFLDAWSKDIEDIRSVLGLPKYRFGNSYHITVGNFK